MYFGNHRINQNFGIHTEYQWRRHDLGQTWQQSLMRLGVDWHLNERISLTSGYGWIVSYPYGKQAIPTSFNEHRIWQQLIVKDKQGIFDFRHRYRLEERFLEDRSMSASGESRVNDIFYRWRARYQFLTRIALDRAKRYSFVLYEEVFLGFGKGIGANVLDQNRLYAAFAYQASKDLNLQLGYLNHFVFKPDGQHVERNHTIQASITYNMDFRRKVD